MEEVDEFPINHSEHQENERKSLPSTPHLKTISKNEMKTKKSIK
jgi:hypothetical protein